MKFLRTKFAKAKENLRLKRQCKAKRKKALAQFRRYVVSEGLTNTRIIDIKEKAEMCATDRLLLERKVLIPLILREVKTAGIFRRIVRRFRKIEKISQNLQKTTLYDIANQLPEQRIKWFRSILENISEEKKLKLQQESKKEQGKSNVFMAFLIASSGSISMVGAALTGTNFRDPIGTIMLGFGVCALGKLALFELAKKTINDFLFDLELKKIKEKIKERK